jgi:4-carboxymuconolactone decarboxylase
MSSNLPRFPIVPEAEWTEAQKALIQQYRQSWRGPNVAAGGKPIGGPLDATFRSPELAGYLARVSNYLRDDTPIPKKLKEFVILLVSQHWNCEYELYIHTPFALREGLSQTVIDAVTSNRKPESMPEDEEIVYQLIQEIQTTRQLSDTTFERAKQKFGERQVVDLVAAAGYYGMVSMFFAMSQVKPVKT